MGRASLVIAWMCVAACGPTQHSDAARTQDQPARVVPIAGAGVSRVILTGQAADRIGIKTDTVREVSAAGGNKAVPVAALLYDNSGKTWVFTLVGTLTYVRQPVTVSRIDGDSAILSSGPAPGTIVVTVGAAELLGAESGVAGE
jgi:hypothetical protein